MAGAGIKTKRLKDGSAFRPEAASARSYLIDNVSEFQSEWLEGVEVVGVTAGASAPENLVQDVVGCFRAMGVEEFENFEATTEKVAFALPSGSFQAFAKDTGDATAHH